MSENHNKRRLGWQSLEYFARSRNRLRIVAAVYDTPQTPATLEETLEMPRSTLRRLVTGLEDEGWLYSTPSKELHPTLPARLLVNTLSETLDSLDAITRLAVHLTDLPPAVAHGGLTAIDTDDIQAKLDQSQVTLPTPANPYAPTHRFADQLAATCSIEVVVPAVHPMWGPTIEQHVADGYSCELITTQPALHTVAQRYEGIIQTGRQTGAVTIYSISDVPEYGLALLDDVIVVAGYDTDRRMRSLLEVSRDCSAVESWATETVATHCTAATEVNIDELDYW